MLASRVASSDDPITHHSYDVNIDVTVDSADDFLTGDLARHDARAGHAAPGARDRRRTRSGRGRRPATGFEALGSWIWDCDHYQGRGEKTEFHPFRAAWVVRHPESASPTSRDGAAEGDLYISTDATPAGQAGRVRAPDEGRRISSSVLALRTRTG